MQSGVSPAGGTVQDGSSYKHHVSPLNKRPTGQLVEEGFLVEAADVEVGVAERGAQTRICKSLLLMDELSSMVE